jgi:hypothetical protein
LCLMKIQCNRSELNLGNLFSNFIKAGKGL